MYSVRLGYKTAISRILRLLKHGHHAEALVTSVFTVEKTLRRTLKQLIVSAGFTSLAANQIIRQPQGLDGLKKNWKLYDPQNQRITEIVSASDWQTFKTCAEMRNKLVHGERVYDLAYCKQQTRDLLKALERLKSLFDNRYGYSGWTPASRRVKSRLHADPKVSTTPNGTH